MEIPTGRLVSLSEARTTIIPRNDDGSPVSPATVHRWIRKGLLGRDGQRIKLNVMYRGRKPYTTPEAIRMFFQRIAESREAATSEPETITPLHQLKKEGLV